MRSQEEIEKKIEEIETRIKEERDIEMCNRAACERDALQWCLGENVGLHDMRDIIWNEDGSYTVVPWDGK